MEMYKTTVVRKIRITAVTYRYVFATSQEDAEERARAAEAKTNFILNPAAIPKENIQTDIVQVRPELVAPQKGKKRAPLTKTQKSALARLIPLGEKATLRFDPRYSQWLISGSGERYTRFIDTRTVIALRKKNLLIPVPMTPEERRAQTALGLMAEGEFSFKLNMKEVQKRKAYKDAYPT